MSSTRKPKRGRKFRYVHEDVTFDNGKAMRAPKRSRSTVVVQPGLGMLMAKLASMSFGPRRRATGRTGHSVEAAKS